MLLDWLYVWLNLPNWLIFINSVVGYIADVGFLAVFGLFAVYTLQETDKKDRREYARTAVGMLVFLVTSMVAGMIGPILLFFGYLVWNSLREYYYDQTTGKWTLSPK